MTVATNMMTYGDFSPSAHIRALIVETSIVVSCVYTRILMMLFFEVVSVQDEAEALDLLETDKDFDFMLIDAGRPNMDGEQVLCTCFFLNKPIF